MEGKTLIQTAALNWLPSRHSFVTHTGRSWHNGP